MPPVAGHAACTACPAAGKMPVAAIEDRSNVPFAVAFVVIRRLQEVLPGNPGTAATPAKEHSTRICTQASLHWRSSACHFAPANRPNDDLKQQKRKSMTRR